MSLTIRNGRYDDLAQILRLYTQYNHDIPRLAENEETASCWQSILENQNLHYFVGELDGKVVTSCFLAVIPHLASGKPYGLVENVITDEKYRKRGYATALLQYTLQIAWRNNCCQVMLLTGSKDESTLRFYEKAGFKREIKTGFIAYP